MPETGGAVVRVRVALTDGTDLKAFRRGHPQMPLPARFGHEFSGDVAAIGAGVSAFAPGDPILSVHSAPCRACYWCLHAGRRAVRKRDGDEDLGRLRGVRRDTATSSSVTRSTSPPALSYGGSFLEPLACVVHSLRQLNVDSETVLGIVGDGGFGILHALVARAFGIAEPVLIGRRPERLALARSLGIARTLDARAGEVGREIAALTGGRGLDAVVESTGSQAVWESAPDLVRRGGTVSLFGGLPGGTRVSFEAARLHYDEVRLISPFHFTPRAVREAFELLADGKLDVEPLISERFALASVADAFASLDTGHGLKYAIVP